jgi:hypothetical protein
MHGIHMMKQDYKSRSKSKFNANRQPSSNNLVYIESLLN